MEVNYGGGRRMSTPEFRVGDANANCPPPRFCHFKHQILCSLMQKITAVKPIIFTYLIHQHTPLRVKIEKNPRKRFRLSRAPHATSMDPPLRCVPLEF